jgi:hypothetical protein
MSDVFPAIADALEHRQSVTSAFALLVELIDCASAANGAPAISGAAGIELLSLFLREFEHGDQQITELIARHL